MDASDIRDEDFNPSNFEDPAQEAYGVEDGTTDQQEHVADDEAGNGEGGDSELRQDVLQGLGVSNAAYHYAVAAHTAAGQGDMGIGEDPMGGHQEGVVPDELGLGVVGTVDGQVAQDLTGYEMAVQQGLEHQHPYDHHHHHHTGEPQVSAGEYVVEEHAGSTGLDDHHLSTNQFPNPGDGDALRMGDGAGIAHHATGYHVGYAEQAGEDGMEMSLDMVGELDPETTLAGSHDPTNHSAQESGNAGGHEHLAMDPSIDVSAAEGSREPASGKAPKVRHYRKQADISGHAGAEQEYGQQDVPGPSRRRTAGTSRKGMDAGEDADPGGASTSVSVDPETPLSIDEIRRRQNRSRASGKVLPRGGACDFCKRRKLRCDGVRPECGHCAKNVSCEARR